MWGTEPELLVVFDRRWDTGAPGAAVDLAAFGQVTSGLAPRLVLLVAPAGRAGEVAALPGVRGVFVDAVPAGLRAEFDQAENLFVDGWLARRSGKDRGPGDGREWDAPGFAPPDPPSARPAANGLSPGHAHGHRRGPAEGADADGRRPDAEPGLGPDPDC
ncbi:hypothetical protein [Frankia sp. AgKG'84/4]